MHQRQMQQEGPEQWDKDPTYSIAHGAEATAKMKSARSGRKYNLMTQVIPIYGFGILLYILYIIYKLTCKGKTDKSGNYIKVPNTNMGTSKTIANDELARLQERLLNTEIMMERIVSEKSRCSGSGRRRKSKTTTSKNEENLLLQLRQITQLMQEGRLDGASPEMEAEEVPYGAEWEGYPEETYPVYPVNDSDDRPKIQTFMLVEPYQQPTAEALAERMEQEEEDIIARKLSVVREEDEEEEGDNEEEEAEETEEDMEEDEEEAEAEKRNLLCILSSQPSAERERERRSEVSKELQCLNGEKKQISFSEHKDVFHYPKEDAYEEHDQRDVKEEDGGTEAEAEEEADYDDPVIEAESLQFSCIGCPNPEEESEWDSEGPLLVSEEAGSGCGIHEMPKEVQAWGLRMRNRRET